MDRKVLAAQNVSRMCMVCGAENPWSLKARFYELDNGELLGVFAPLESHQSYPGRLHGGVASALLDETIGRAIPNTPMVGALTRITGLFPIENVVEFLRADFGKKFPPKVVEGNIKAITRSYEEVQGE